MDIFFFFLFFFQAEDGIRDLVRSRGLGDVYKRQVGWDVDDTAWAPATVPGHWRMNPAFAANDEPLLYLSLIHI